MTKGFYSSEHLWGTAEAWTERWAREEGGSGRGGRMKQLTSQYHCQEYCYCSCGSSGWGGDTIILLMLTLPAQTAVAREGFSKAGSYPTTHDIPSTKEDLFDFSKVPDIDPLTRSRMGSKFTALLLHTPPPHPISFLPSLVLV